MANCLLELVCLRELSSSTMEVGLLAAHLLTNMVFARTDTTCQTRQSTHPEWDIAGRSPIEVPYPTRRI